jgi:hypothetical protein
VPDVVFGNISEKVQESGFLVIVRTYPGKMGKYGGAL